MTTDADLAAAERAVLGGVLLRPSLIDVARGEGFTAEHLYREPHRVVWRAYQACWEAEGGVDVVSLPQYLGARALEQLGGFSWLTSLPAGCPSSTPGVWLGYVATVMEGAARRALLTACRDALHAHTEGEPLAALVGILRQALEPLPEQDGTVWHRGDHVEMGAHLFAHLGGAGELVCDQGELRRWTEGEGWTLVSGAELRNAAAAFAGTRRRAGRQRGGGIKFEVVKMGERDVLGVAARAQALSTLPGFFTSSATGAAYQNGVVVVDGEGLRLEGLEARHRVLREHVMPWAYDPNARCPRWLAFLREIWPTDDAEERIRFLGEFVGAAIAGVAPRFSKAVVLHGGGSNGKSVLIGVIRQLLPDTQAIPWQLLGASRDPSRYWVAMLRGCRLNLVEEMPRAALTDTSALKAVIDGGEVQARLPHIPPFSFVPRAAHVVACNELPAVSDSSHGFWRRLVLLNFPRRFTAEDADVSLPERLSEELSGISTWALSHLPALLARGHYGLPPSLSDAISAWRADSTPAIAWAKEHLEPFDKGTLRARDDVYVAYRSWAKEGGYLTVSERRFAAQLVEAGFTKDRTKVGSVWRAAFKGAP